MNYFLNNLGLRSRRLIVKQLRNTMSVFVQKLNPITGMIEWDTRDENYDYHQEIARSAYADMLHDTERNQKYYEALREAIASLRSRNLPVHVLDIGTGTGLLSMMAATCGADTVTACEAFYPIAKCAQQVIKDNGFGDKIKLVAKRSNEMTVGSGCDLEQKATILVTEVFDTELIGEGAIPTFVHAHKELLEKDCIVIPSEATVYAQVVESDLVSRWNCFYPIQIPGGQPIVPPTDAENCQGAAAVHDIQLSQLSPRCFRPVTTALPVFKFDFSGKIPLVKCQTSVVDTTSLISGTGHAVFMWWELKMHPNDTTHMSCAPMWAHVDGVKAQWRDHWMQAVYFLAKPETVVAGQSVRLFSNHDEYSLWFDMKMSNNTSTTAIASDERPICKCGAHVAFSRSRVGMMNDITRQTKYINVLQKLVGKDCVCLCLGDGSLLPLLSASLTRKKVFAIETKILSRQVMQSFVEANGLKDKVEVLSTPYHNLQEKDLHDQKVDVLIAEPFFLTSLLPWDNLQFWYARSAIAAMLSDNVKVMPQSACLRAVAVQFEDLWKIKAPLESVEGFNMVTFDSLIAHSSEISDPPVEPHALWEYPCVALSKTWTMLEFDFTKQVPVEKVEEEGEVKLSSTGVCNGFVMWMDWNLDDHTVISSGPSQPVHIDQQVVWDMYSRQGVYFYESGLQKNETAHYQVVFQPKCGSIDFTFHCK